MHSLTHTHTHTLMLTATCTPCIYYCIYYCRRAELLARARCHLGGSNASSEQGVCMCVCMHVCMCVFMDMRILITMCKSECVKIRTKTIY